MRWVLEKNRVSTSITDEFRRSGQLRGASLFREATKALSHVRKSAGVSPRSCSRLQRQPPGPSFTATALLAKRDPACAMPSTGARVMVGARRANSRGYQSCFLTYIRVWILLRNRHWKASSKISAENNTDAERSGNPFLPRVPRRG